MTIRSHRPGAIRVGGRPRRSGPLPILLALSVLLNLYLLWAWGPGDDPPDESSDTTADGEETPESPDSTVDADGATDPDAELSTPAPDGAAAPPAEDAVGTPKFAHIVIDGAVSRGFVNAVGSPEGDRLALTAERILVWNLDLRKDPRAGDTVDVLYEVDPTDPTDITIYALRYRSAKFDKTFDAYRYQPPGWKFPSWFDAEGREVPSVLEGGPIEEYAQITSLIGDGRGHSGMDFKAPVGTKVTAPFAGVVTRTTWRFKYNGNSVELKGADGRTAKFLHLKEVADGVEAGTRVEAGQLIALSGNTGRSSAPHLHYELANASGRILDPLDVHETRRRVLGASDKASFQLEAARLLGKLGADLVVPDEQADAAPRVEGR